MILKYKCCQLGLYWAGEHDNEDNINKKDNKDNRDSNHNSIGNKDKVNENNI